MPVPAGSLLTKIEAVEPISRALSRAAPLRCQSSSNTPSRTQRQNSALSRAGGLHLQPTEGGLAGALAAKLVDASKVADLGQARPVDGVLFVGKQHHIESRSGLNAYTVGVEADRLDAVAGGRHGSSHPESCRGQQPRQHEWLD